jgi:AcrR family transcriptional regulator
MKPEQETSANEFIVSGDRRRRSDGIEARERLLQVALRLFAENGYAKASTRDIAQAAGLNVASIKYYFGDKAGLYRAVFGEAIEGAAVGIPLYDRDDFTLRQSLQGFLARYTEPLKQGDFVRLCTKLHFREVLEPTGMWAKEIENIRHAHAALIRVLCRHLGVARADDDVHRLAFSIAGLGVQIYAMHDVICAIRPRLIDAPSNVDVWAERLVDCAEAMVRAEAERRASGDKRPSTRNTKKKA